MDLAAAALAAALTSSPGHVTVRPGDTLSGIAAARCGTPAAYPALAAASGIANPDVIYPGQQVTLTCRHTATTTAAAVSTGRHAAATGRHAAAHGGTYGHPYFCGDGDGDGWDMPCSRLHHHGGSGYTGRHRTHRTRHYQATATSSTYHGTGSMEACIIARESGGNSQVMNSTGHYGLYQFSEQTWVASGGSAATFGHASVAEQRQVFRNAVAARGYSDWTPYDGC